MSEPPRGPDQSEPVDAGRSTDEAAREGDLETAARSDSAVDQGVDSPEAESRETGSGETAAASDANDWERHAATVDPDGCDDDLDESDADTLDDDEDASRVTAWITERARATSGRFRQTAQELRQALAGEASARVAVDNLHARPPTEKPPTQAPRDLTAAAFFDVDNTLVQGASIIHFARGLAAHKYFSYGDILDFAWTQAKFRITGKENADDVAEGREKALSFIAGRETSELIALGEEIYDEYIADKIWPGTRALAQRHLDAGQQVWLVTATPVELAQTIAERLGLTGALGTVAESVDGVFTGRLVGDILHGPGKAHAVRALAIREGLNLKRCTAYSDSHNDVPMLSLVGTAVAINPDADLREVAKVRGWEMYDFRTARKAAKYGAGTALALGAAGAGAATASRLLRQYRG
ncbi:HAD-IB family hydrolase [Gordonia sp. CPCC 206044]|uniref:HAD family hydrolase n=1 Tax=Gordonia sp. CPCC 206044 TaxID=3140793 RepID=UPI003AF384C3